MLVEPPQRPEMLRQIPSLIVSGAPLPEIFQQIAALIEVDNPGDCALVLNARDGRINDYSSGRSTHIAELAKLIGAIPAGPIADTLTANDHARATRYFHSDENMPPAMARALLAAGFDSLTLVPAMRIDPPVPMGAVLLFHTATDQTDTAPPASLSTAADLVALAVNWERSKHDLTRAELRDPLTNLPTHALLIRRLAQRLEQARPNKRQVGIAFVDLDNFKLINDTFGHDAGDALLIMVAARLRELSNQADTIARVGADEFVITYERRGGLTGIVSFADELNEAMHAPFNLDDTEIVITASLGVAVDHIEADAATLIREADAAMFRAKQRGRDRVEIFDPAMRASATERIQLATDLRKAIERSELRLVYQPIVELASGLIVGAEALCRWTHPVRGEVSPGKFIPIAEDTGVMRSLGLWVLQTATAELAPLTDVLLPPRLGRRTKRLFSLSANLSPRQLDEPDLAKVLAEISAEHGWQPTQISLELTETAITDDLYLAESALNKLRDAGMLIAMDDFGTGFSSLTHLQRLPLDGVKIDISFVRELGEHGEADRGSIVAAVLAMCRAMNLTAVAEGIENIKQLSALRDLGCEFGQGFLFSNPVSADQLVELVANTSLEPRLKAN